MMRIVITAALVCGCLTGCDVTTTTNNSPVQVHRDGLSKLTEKTPNAQSSVNYNAIAFRKAQQGVSAAMKHNWSTANMILDDIEIGRIDDTEVLAYVDYCKRCARVAQDIGISSKSNPNSITDTAASLDLSQLAVMAWKTVESEGFSDAAQLAVDAKRVRDEIPMWQKLDAQLFERYGNDNE